MKEEIQKFIEHWHWECLNLRFVCPMRYSDAEIDFVITEWQELKGVLSIEVIYEKVADHVNKTFYKGHHRFFASDVEKIICKYQHRKYYG